MTTTIKLTSKKLIDRLDKKQAELNLDTRTNLVSVLLRKGLDYLDKYGYDRFIKISSSEGICKEGISGCTEKV